MPDAPSVVDLMQEPVDVAPSSKATRLREGRSLGPAWPEGRARTSRKSVVARRGRSSSTGRGTGPVRVHPLERGRWVVQAGPAWTLYDPRLGWVAAVKQTLRDGEVTSDGAWIANGRSAIRLDPTPVKAGRQRHGLQWNDSFARVWTPVDAPLVGPPDCGTQQTTWRAPDGGGACLTALGLLRFDARHRAIGHWPSDKHGLDPGNVAFHPAGDVVALAGTGGTIALWWPAEDRFVVLPLEVSKRTPGVAFVGDGAAVVVADYRGRQAVFAHDGRRLDDPSRHPAVMEHVRFDESGELRLDADSSDHRDARWGVVYRGSEAWVQQAGTDAQVPWKPGALEALGRPDHVTVDDAGVVFASWGTTLARLVDSGAAVTWEAPRPVVAWAAAHGQLVTSHGDGSVLSWSYPLAEGSEVASVPLASPPDVRVDLRADLPPPPADAAGPRLRRAGDGWVLQAGGTSTPLVGMPYTDAAAVARDTARVVLGVGDELWIRDPDRSVRKIRVGAVDQVAISPDGRWVAVRSDLGVVLVDGQRGELRVGVAPAEASTRRRSADAWELRFSDDSRRLYLDRQWVWTVPDGDMVLQRGMGPIRHLAVSRDGRVLAVASEREVVLVDTDDPEHPVWFHDVGRPDAIGFVKGDPRALLVEASTGYAVLRLDGTLERHGLWPFSSQFGLLVTDDGTVRVHDGATWWTVDPVERRIVDGELARMRPSWFGLDATPQVVGPGIHARAPSPHASCAMTLSLTCDPSGPAGVSFDLAGLSEPWLATPTGRWLLGARDGGMVARGVGGWEMPLGGDWTAQHAYTWTADDRLLAVGDGTVVTWTPSLWWRRTWDVVPGETLAVAASGNRVVRLLQGRPYLLVAEDLGAPHPVCALAVSQHAPLPLAVSPNGRWAAWAPDGLADLHSCTMVAEPITFRGRPDAWRTATEYDGQPRHRRRARAAMSPDPRVQWSRLGVEFQAVAVAPTGELVVAHGDGVVQIVRADSLPLTSSLPPPPGPGIRHHRRGIGRRDAATRAP